jgi:hypothetical protein
MNARAARLPAILLFSVLALTGQASAQTGPAPDDASIRIQRTNDGRSLLSFPVEPRKENDFSAFEATFDFGRTKGLGKDDRPVVNQDKSLIAVTNYSATKTSYVHLLIRQPNGDLTVINTVNLRVANLLRGRWARAAEYRLAATAISGRIMQLSVFDDIGGNETQEYRFQVSVGADGALALAR